uniref:BTB domain-containing protein n=1 Tax=Parastrongyloides trichosuri TaxID=131310 RepID=A0A0N4ZU74_PARTI
MDDKNVDRISMRYMRDMRRPMNRSLDEEVVLRLFNNLPSNNTNRINSLRNRKRNYPHDHTGFNLYNFDQSITSEFTVATKKNKITYNFKEPGNLGDDTTLNIDGNKIYINKHYLSAFSPVFEKMFFSSFAESKMDEIPLKDVNVNDFIELLNAIYPSQKEVSKNNVKILLQLGDKFNMKFLINKCERFLIETNTVPLPLKLVLSITYSLTKLHIVCLSSFKSISDFKELKRSKEYAEITDTVKLELFEKFMNLP